MTTPNHIPAQSVVRLPRRGFLSGMAAVAGATTIKLVSRAFFI